MQSKTLLVELDNQIIRCLVRIKSSNRHRYIAIKDATTVEIRTPMLCDDSEIKRMLFEKKKWILSKLARYAPIPENSATNELQLFNKTFSLEINLGTANESITCREHLLTVHATSKEAAHEKIAHFLEYYLYEHLLQRVSYFSAIMGVQAHLVEVKRVKSYWGRCTQHNALAFNATLVYCSDEVIDYVVVHELAHIVHKNHSAAFWQLVGEVLINAKELRKKLRHFEKNVAQGAFNNFL